MDIPKFIENDPKISRSKDAWWLEVPREGLPEQVFPDSTYGGPEESLKQVRELRELLWGPPVHQN